MRKRLLFPLVLSALSWSAPLLAQTPDFRTAGHEAVALLQGMVRIDSSSPPGNETQVAEFIQGVLAAEGIDSNIYEMEVGRGNLVARIPGNGSKRPILLMGHIDVVGVERDMWSVDPFAGLIQDGYLWGRGSQDDKGMTASATESGLRASNAAAEQGSRRRIGKTYRSMRAPASAPLGASHQARLVRRQDSTPAVCAFDGRCRPR